MSARRRPKGKGAGRLQKLPDSNGCQTGTAKLPGGLPQVNWKPGHAWGPGLEHLLFPRLFPRGRLWKDRAHGLAFLRFGEPLARHARPARLRLSGFSRHVRCGGGRRWSVGRGAGPFPARRGRERRGRGAGRSGIGGQREECRLPAPLPGGALSRAARAPGERARAARSRAVEGKPRARVVAGRRGRDRLRAPAERCLDPGARPGRGRILARQRTPSFGRRLRGRVRRRRLLAFSVSRPRKLHRWTVGSGRRRARPGAVRLGPGATSARARRSLLRGRRGAARDRARTVGGPRMRRRLARLGRLRRAGHQRLHVPDRARDLELDPPDARTDAGHRAALRAHLLGARLRAARLRVLAPEPGWAATRGRMAGRRPRARSRLRGADDASHPGPPRGFRRRSAGRQPRDRTTHQPSLGRHHGIHSRSVAPGGPAARPPWLPPAGRLQRTRHGLGDGLRAKPGRPPRG